MIRLANKNDIPFIHQLLEEVLAVHANIRPDIFKPIGVKYTDDELEQIINDPSRPIFIYEKNNIVLAHAFCEIHIKKETTNTLPSKELFIDDLCVSETLRGQGIGQKMIGYISNYCKEQDIHTITLHVWEGNDDAIKFYDKQGFFKRSYTLEKKI